MAYHVIWNNIFIIFAVLQIMGLTGFDSKING